MPLTINELLDKAIEHARATLIDKPDAQLIPTWLIQAKDRTTVVGTPWDGDDEKRIMLFAIRMMLKKEKAQSYSFMSEAWMATEGANHPTGLMPRDREDRREVVMVNAYDRLGFGAMRTYEMKRNDKGVVTDLLMDEPVEGFSGRLANLFKEDSHAG